MHYSNERKYPEVMAQPSLNTVCDPFIQLHNLFTLLTCSYLSLYRLWSYSDRQSLYSIRNLFYSIRNLFIQSAIFLFISAIFILLSLRRSAFFLHHLLSFFLANGRDHHGPPRGLRVVHEAHGERAEGAGRVPRGLGLDSAAYERLPHRGVPPGNASLQTETFIRIHGQLIATLH